MCGIGAYPPTLHSVARGLPPLRVLARSRALSTRQYSGMYPAACSRLGCVAGLQPHDTRATEANDVERHQPRNQNSVSGGGGGTRPRRRRLR